MRRLLLAAAIFAAVVGLCWVLTSPTAVTVAVLVGTASGLAAWVIGDILHRRL